MLQGLPEHIIYALMEGKAAIDESTRETMGAHVVNPCTAIAGMFGADERDKSRTECRAYRLDAIGNACSQSLLWCKAIQQGVLRRT